MLLNFCFCNNLFIVNTLFYNKKDIAVGQGNLQVAQKRIRE